MNDNYLIAVGFAKKQENSSKDKKKPDDNSIEVEIKRKSIFEKITYYFGKSILDYYFKDKQFIHCEIAFIEENNNNKCKAAGVFEEDGVFFKDRTFDNPYYKYITIEVSKSSYNKIKNFCMREAKKGCKFDFYGSKLSAIWPISTKEKWWCVPLVVCALQRGGILLYYKPESLDADDVFYLLSTCTKKLIAPPPNTLKDKNKKKKYFEDISLFKE